MAGMPAAERLVTVGIDSHNDIHVAAAVEKVGRIAGTTAAPTTVRGSAQLERWARGVGPGERFGGRGDRQRRRRPRPLAWWPRRPGRGGQPARPAAASAAWQVRPPRRRRSRPRRAAGEDVATPKAANGTVAMVRAVRVARRPAVHARTQPRNPARLPGRHRTRRAPLPAPRSGTRPAGRGRRRPPPSGGTGRVAATKLALGELARRHPALGAEIDRLDTELAKLAPKVAPALLARRGVGAGAAGAVLIAAGDNPGRLRSQRPRLRCCAGPRQSSGSSGKTVRRRRNRGGDRLANNALG
jgi:transposase